MSTLVHLNRLKSRLQPMAKGQLLRDCLPFCDLLSGWASPSTFCMALRSDLDSIRIGYLGILHPRPHILYLVTSAGSVYSRLPVDDSTPSASQVSILTNSQVVPLGRAEISRPIEYR